VNTADPGVNRTLKVNKENALAPKVISRGGAANILKM
jgi:hypothetical protein